MLKPASLRAFLTRHVPGLGANPDRLELFVEKGGIVCYPTRTLSYENRYTLVIALTPFAGDVDDLFVPLLAWIAAHEPTLLEQWDRGGEQPFAYKAEILDTDAVDLEITLALTERVIVTARTDAPGFVAQPANEPPPPDAFDGLDPLALLRRLYLDADVVAETADPGWLADHPRP